MMEHICQFFFLSFFYFSSSLKSLVLCPPFALPLEMTRSSFDRYYVIIVIFEGPRTYRGSLALQCCLPTPTHYPLHSTSLGKKQQPTAIIRKPSNASYSLYTRTHNPIVLPTIIKRNFIHMNTQLCRLIINYQ